MKKQPSYTQVLSEGRTQVAARTLSAWRYNTPLGNQMHLHTPRTNNPQKRAVLMLTEVRKLADIYHSRLWIVISPINDMPLVCGRDGKNSLSRQFPGLQVTEIKPSYESV